MTCPKNLRNGPCGGTFNGQCEVVPEIACIWVKVYDTAQSANRVEELKVTFRRAIGRCKGPAPTSIFLDRDSRPEHPQPVILDQQSAVVFQARRPSQSGSSAGQDQRLEVVYPDGFEAALAVVLASFKDSGTDR